MSWNETSDHYRPMLWWRGYPIYASTLLMGLHLVTMLACVIVQATGRSYFFPYVEFSSVAVIQHAYLWQWLTYAFVNPPTFSFLFGLLALFWFGPDVEKFIGSRNFLLFYATELLLVPALLTILGLFQPYSFVGFYLLHLSVFVAFVTIYPNVNLIFNFPAKWIAAAILGINVLQDVAANAWIHLGVLVSTVLWAYWSMQWVGVDGGTSGVTRWLEQRRLDRAAQRQNLRVLRDEEIQLSTDAILEKISRHGLQSLSAQERQLLEQARTTLLAKEQKK